MHKRLFQYLNKQQNKHTVETLQTVFGLQKDKSTDHAVLDLHIKIIKLTEKHEKTCFIFLDFAKEFDTGNHDILLSKLGYYGVRDITLN